VNFLDKFFWKKNPKKSKYLPEKRESLEISFVKKFTLNGGKFLYCENEDELRVNFKNILIENEISVSELLSNEKSIIEYFNIDNNSINPKALVMNCEFLISNQGSIMVSNHQILDKKLNQLPDILIIRAETSDFKYDVSEAMSGIKNKYGESIPSNITNIHPTNRQTKSNFMSYKRTSKDLYLLLMDVIK